MADQVSFGNLNSGVQVGVNHGQIQFQSSHGRWRNHTGPRMFTNCDIDPLKELPEVLEAEYGSYMDQHEDECLSGTRTALLNDITTWAKSPQGKRIFWLNGMAGTGKSTISRTVAGIFQRENLLGASFFFKWGEADRGNARKFIPTIAKQLIHRYPGLTDSLRKTVHANPGIMSKSLNRQFNRLLYGPLRALGSRRRSSPPPLS